MSSTGESGEDFSQTKSLVIQTPLFHMQHSVRLINGTTLQLVGQLALKNYI